MQPVFRSEHFKVSLQNADTLEYSPVTVEVGIDGMKVHDASGNRVLSIYPMKDISRWSLTDAILRVYVKARSDVEERQIQFRGAITEVQSLLDSLTCAAHQMLEVIESKKAEAAQSSSLKDRTRQKSKNQTSSVEDVEFWNSPEKEGWMHSQGEVIKTWRRRWFVLKSGFLFRFLTKEIDPSSKPRGIVDLSTITDITEGSSITGKANSIKLSTATGHVCYCTDSEMDTVEWISALDTVHKKIVKRAAGIEEEDDVGSKSESRVKWTEDRVRKTYDLGTRSDSDMVSVVGYDNYSSASAPPDASSNPSRINYNEIDGISGVVNGTQNDRLVRVSYGGQNFTPAAQTPTENTGYARPGMYPPRQPPTASYGVNYPSTPVPPQQYTPSFLDQAPQQTPTYPAFPSIGGLTYRPQVPNVASSAPSPMHNWQVIHTPDGRVYYHNRTTGQTQWERPSEIIL
eukprot:g7813.t1